MTVISTLSPVRLLVTDARTFVQCQSKCSERIIGTI